MAKIHGISMYVHLLVVWFSRRQPAMISLVSAIGLGPCDQHLLCKCNIQVSVHHQRTQDTHSILNMVRLGQRTSKNSISRTIQDIAAHRHQGQWQAISSTMLLGWLGIFHSVPTLP